jgi:DNA (cytosine-5)-methyltransferase 1
MKPTYLEFFAGSGLVTEALKREFTCVWANDICPKKAAIYQANHGSGHFHLGSISDVKGSDLPTATMAWASFPCQDLSLAGNLLGLDGNRSGLVWQWLRILDEMGNRCPSILIAENVLGLVTAFNGNQYLKLHQELANRGYQCGAMVLNATEWVPQSRPRVFIVAVRKKLAKKFHGLPDWNHPEAILRVADRADGWVWWNLPRPPARTTKLDDILELDTPCHNQEKSQDNLNMVPPGHSRQLLVALANGFVCAPGYKRTRKNKQVLELRFDNTAGCLRTPGGGSSRQLIVLRQKDGKLATRLLTVRETARLMGAPDSYQLPGTYNDGYKAMGDAVAVPVARYLSKQLLVQLAS